MKNLFSILIFIIFSICIVEYSFASRVQTNLVSPQDMRIKKTGLWLQDAAEGSWFEWEGTLHYAFTERSLDASNKHIKIADFQTNKVISTFAEGFGFQDVIVQGDTFHVFMGNVGWSTSKGEKGNGIWYTSSKNLIDFSEPRMIKEMPEDTTVYNVSVTINDQREFVVAYEFKDPYLIPFSIRFIKSKNLQVWQDVGSTFGGQQRVGCPDIKFIGGKYYMWFGETIDSPKPYVTNMAMSDDLSVWKQSRLATLSPTFDYEDINNSDPDVFEYQGKVYVMYLVSDQQTYTRMTYATFDGTLQQFVEVYYVNNEHE
jgi:hypothetical protein